MHQGSCLCFCCLNFVEFQQSFKRSVFPWCLWVYSPSKQPLRLYFAPCFLEGPNTFQRVYGAPTGMSMVAATEITEIPALHSSGYPKLKGNRCTSPGSWKSLSMAGLMGTSCKTKLKFSWRARSWKRNSATGHGENQWRRIMGWSMDWF